MYIHKALCIFTSQFGSSMNKTIIISVPYYKINDTSYIKQQIQEETGWKTFYYKIIKRSIDARSKQIKYILKIIVSRDTLQEDHLFIPHFSNIDANSKVVHIIGAGPSGLFAALKCLELGLKPIIFEQGKNVRDRRWDLANITKKGIINPVSNYCFGEGGAGTYSDGKLYTRSDKRGDVSYVLNYLVYFGASPDILIDAHPHIGTNKLPSIIETIRHTIITHGGEIYFQHQLINIQLDALKEKVTCIYVKDIEHNHILEISCDNLVLATGHSARMIYELLHQKNIAIEFKPFALGVRVEHPQDLIDSIQYHCYLRDELQNIRKHLPPARYTLVHSTSNYSAYSFCMCPGGIIAPCATDVHEVVTNGWSPSKRNNPYANSGIVVAVNEKHISSLHPLAGIEYQREIEQKAYISGGKNLYAPAQRLIDFVRDKESSSLPNCSYRPGVTPTHLKSCLPEYIYNTLKEAFIQFDKKMKGFLSEEAVVVAPESRTSSPVRIPRHKDKYHHVQIKNLYPCAEGAGYAGGIVSAAIDGMNVILAIYKTHSH